MTVVFYVMLLENIYYTGVTHENYNMYIALATDGYDSIKQPSLLIQGMHLCNYELF